MSVYIFSDNCTDFKQLWFIPFPQNNFAIPQEEMIYVKKSYIDNLYNDWLMQWRKRYWEALVRLYAKVDELKRSQAPYSMSDNSIWILSWLEAAIYIIENPESDY